MLKAMKVGKVHLLPGLFREREEVNHGLMVQAQTVYPSLCYYENENKDANHRYEVL